MEEFNVYAIATREQASKEIADRVESIEKQYKELIEIADEWGMYIHLDLNSPRDRGHNEHGNSVSWSASSQAC